MSFRWTAKELSHTYTCIHSPLNSFPIQAATCHWAELLLCYTVGPCWLSILNIAVCACPSQAHYPFPPATLSSFGKWYYSDDCSGKCTWRPNSVESSLCPLLPEISSFQWNWCFSPTSIPFRKWWDSSGDDIVAGNGHLPRLMIVPAATGRRLCGCLLKPCTYPPVTQTSEIRSFR